MIIVKILGGLGNQLFQYAAAKALAYKNHTEAKIDISGFVNYDLRNFELNKLGIVTAIASQAEIEKLKAKNSIERIKAKLTNYSTKRFYKEPFFHYDANFFKLENEVYVQGYFQSEKYFFAIKDEVRNEFSANSLYANSVIDFAKALSNHNSVAIHIRKGDYKNSKVLKVHGMLTSTYYEKAIGYIRSRFPDARFYLFSDDVESAEKELDTDALQVVSGAITQNHLQDFYLMSQCRHNIIANSSFSWWAAWLNKNPDKIIIGPKNWFNKGPKDTYDIMPGGWIKL